MDDILDILQQLGLGAATNAIYDWLKSKASDAPVSKEALETDLQNFMHLKGVEAKAATVIEALASKGVLMIEGSDLYAPNMAKFGSAGGRATMGDNSTLRTDKAGVVAGKDAFVATEGNAHVVLAKDGSIRFMT